MVCFYNVAKKYYKTYFPNSHPFPQPFTYKTIIKSHILLQAISYVIYFTLTKFQKPQEVEIISPLAGQPLISSNNIASKWWIEVFLQNVLVFFLNHYGKLPPRVFKFLNQCASFQCKCHTLLRNYHRDIFRPLKPLSLSRAKEISQEEHAWKHVQLDV